MKQQNNETNLTQYFICKPAKNIVKAYKKDGTDTKIKLVFDHGNIYMSYDILDIYIWLFAYLLSF